MSRKNKELQAMKHRIRKFNRIPVNNAKYLEKIYADQEQIKWWFDAFCFWGLNAADMPKNIREYINGIVPDGYSVLLDGWYRGVLTLNKEQAQELKTMIDQWNNPVDGEWHAYQVVFHVAVGTEHEIEVSTGGRYMTLAWQR